MLFLMDMTVIEKFYLRFFLYFLPTYIVYIVTDSMQH